MERKRKNLKITLLLLFMIVVAGGIYLYKSDIFTSPLKRLNYSETTIKYLEESKLDETIISNNKYYKTLDVAISQNKYNNDNFNKYLEINFVEYDKFIDNVNELIKIGYTNDEINTIISKYNPNINSDDLLTIIINKPKNKKVTKLFDLSYYKNDYLKRYINYIFEFDDLSLEDAVTYVNIGLDTKVFDDAKSVTDQGNDLILVNKYNKVSKDYVPEDLETVNSKWTITSVKLVKNAKTAFEKMASKMNDLGLGIKITTSYRTYAYQETLFNNSVKNDGLEHANKYVARPGFSEHQSGYAADLVSTSTNGNSNSSNRGLFVDSKEYAWLIKNAHQYGFILRYPNGKEKITGYNFESWHYRYVGVEVATYIYENNLTLEEYIARK